MLWWAGTAGAGWIEDRDGKTIIHVTLYKLPDPTNTSTSTRADVAAVNEFVRRFPEIFAQRYRARYQADPARYGKHHWDQVEIKLHQFSGIQVEGVATDLLAIAGRVAPDVLYVNFMKSGNWISGGFLYPLDKPEDGYLSSMSQEQIDFRVHPKLWPVIKRRAKRGGKNTCGRCLTAERWARSYCIARTCSTRTTCLIRTTTGPGMISTGTARRFATRSGDLRHAAGPRQT